MTLEQRLQETVERGEAARIALIRLRQIAAAVRVQRKQSTTEPRASDGQRPT